MKITTICFLMGDDSVYLAEKKQGFGIGYLNGYGGKNRKGERIEDTAARELKEEAGLTVSPQRLEKVAVVDFFEDQEHIFECHIFFVSQWKGEFKESEEMSYPREYKLNNLPYEKMWKSDRVWLPLIFSGKKIKAKAYYEKGMDEVKDFDYELL